MSHFYGSMQGGRGEATRTGTKASGIEGHLRGWDTGVRVRVTHDELGRDHIQVWRTAGSNGSNAEELIAQWWDGGKVCYWQLPRSSCPHCTQRGREREQGRLKSYGVSEWPSYIPKSLRVTSNKKGQKHDR